MIASSLVGESRSGDKEYYEIQSKAMTEKT
jgi:hypothetical protein